MYQKNKENNMKLWYHHPAKQWVEALPIGNGRLGGMIFGNVSEERIQLNEDSIWYGGPKDAVNPDGLKYLSEIRKMLFAGRVEEASYLARMAMYSTPKYLSPYQPLGDLKIFFTGIDGETEGYVRELDLNTGIASVRYIINGVNYSREIFSSYPDQVMVLHMESEVPGKLNFCVNLNRRPYEGESFALTGDTIVMNGECGKKGVEFSCVLKAISKDGIVKTIGDFIAIENASEVTFLLSANSTFRENNPQEASLMQISSAAELCYADLKLRHIEDYQKLFHRVRLTLSQSEDYMNLPTDERLEKVKNGGEDTGLMEMFFNYGRYLMISCSRPGCLPSNLQGIWNESFTPPWESKYTININTEMNYWPAEVCGLGECHEPLFDFVDRLRIDGRKTAKKLYGCSGFVAHHNTSIWAETRPEGMPLTAVLWPMGAAWLSLHLWEHYAFTLDKDFLVQKAYPIMKEAAEFFFDYLVETPDGGLVTGPSISPENLFYAPNGSKSAICMGPTMDTQIINELFSACIKSSKILNTDVEFRDKLAVIMERLPKPQIGKYGQMLEWYEEYEEVYPGHRHISHLFALHPGSQITPEGTPELAAAARKTLEHRLENGGGHTGWSCAWIINMFARLGDGENAYKYALDLLRKSTYPNLFDAHPPFQIDGNFGTTAGVAEMLLQSHTGKISMLPALPKAWNNGKVCGLRARGGFQVDMAWEEGKLTKAAVLSIQGETCRIKGEVPLKVIRGNEEILIRTKDENTFEFDTESGKCYNIIF
jgi:alpha-L-fucosidase 2